MDRSARFLVALVFCAASAGCGEDDGGGTADDGTQAAPLELTTNLCDDPTNMAVLLESPNVMNLLSSDQFNEEQVQRMIEAPTKGPFYMFNLLNYREKAEYFDGRPTDLTGREANALYAPVEFLTAIGARPVFSTEVHQQIDGDETVWETVIIVEYPCPLALFAMFAHPEFQARAIHKDAGVDKTIALVTDLAPSPLPPGFEPPEGPYPATEDDPAFELIHVQDFHEIAQYEPGTDEPTRTGQEAWQLYVANGAQAGGSIGSYPTARLIAQGVFLGDDRTWDEINIIHMPSLAGFRALLDNATRQEGRYHRLAALANNYSLITYPSVVTFAGAPGETDPPPVTSDGVGMICASDEDCPSDGVGLCLTGGGAAGFCTREGCRTGECLAPYVCCHSCSDTVASRLPFDGSACLPGNAVEQLTAAPASCTCD